ATLYERPASTFVANFLGQSNLLEGRVSGPAVDGLVPVRTHDQDVWVSPDRLPAGLVDVWLGVRPEKLRLGEGGRNCLRGTVTDASFTGVATQYLIRMPWGFEVVVVQQNDGSARARAGDQVTVSWDPGQEFILDQAQDSGAGVGIDDE
ncbi:MAG: TOBE domain-containing protein, partial [Nostocoides sp.]